MHFIPSADGLDVETGPGTFVMQGHQDQFVAEMVEWGVSPDRKFIVGGKDYTFNDFLRFSKARVSVKTPQELEWALVIIGTHYGTNCRVDQRLRRKSPLRRPDPGRAGQGYRQGGLRRHAPPVRPDLGLSPSLAHSGETTGVWKEIADRIAPVQEKGPRAAEPRTVSFPRSISGQRGNRRNSAHT